MTRALLLLGLAVPLSAQSPVRLERPDAQFPEPFSNLIGLRELSDGRVIVADRLEQSVVRLDFRSGDMTPIGRQGDGPGEYGMPGSLFALGGDTTIMLDLPNGRGLVITPDARMSSNTVSFSAGESGSLFFPRAVDGRGRFYGTAPMRIGANGPESTDSTAVIRWAPGGTTDTVFQLPNSASGVTTFRIGAGGAGAATAQGRRQAFQRTDQWAPTRDGRVAVVRAEPYHVEWMDGARRTSGPTVPYQPVRVTGRDREAWAAAQSQGTMIVRTPQGSRAMPIPRPNLDEVDFPETKPAFEAVSVTPEGEVWVRVSRPAGATRQLYDVFDGQGRRVRQVELAEGRQLVGFGQGTLYAVRVDEDDLQWLERYRR